MMKYSVVSIICVIASLSLTSNGFAQDCDVPLRIVNCPQVENVPDGVIDMLNSKLSNAVSSDGIIASIPYGQFFITAKFNHITEDVVAGPPRQFAVHTSLTLFIGDLEGQQIYSSKTFDLRGVGSSSQRALINSLQSINSRNSNFEQFVDLGRRKIIAYFDNNYSAILAKANKAARMKKFDEALCYVCSIPECCSGYAEASNEILILFQAYMDSDSEVLYNKAYCAWTSSPNSDGARIASMYLSLIEPSSAVYSKGQQLAKEIKSTVRGDYVFEKQEKYKDSVSIKKAYIDAARQIGVAYGNGQQETTTNLLWIK